MRLRSTMFSLLAVAAVSPIPVLAAPVLTGTQLRTLPNGLRLIVREQHSAPLVAIDVWVRAGSGREGPNESGAAHFMEHLLFKGTPTRKPGEIDAAIEDLGATLAAGTTRDGAHFYTTVASQYTGAALDVIADAVRNAALQPEEIERERAVILDEIARSENDPAKKALDALLAGAYSGHAYRLPVLGDPSSITKLDRETIAAFYHRWYVPNNTTVVVVGDITPDAAETAVAKAFGAWGVKSVPNEPKAESAAPPGTPGSVGPARTGKQAVGVVYRFGEAVDAKELAVAEIVSIILSDGPGGRLRTALDKLSEETTGVQPTRRPFSLSVRVPAELSVEVLPLRSGPAMAITALVEPKLAGPAAEALQQEIRNLWAEATPAEELTYARHRVIGRYLFDIETYAGQARVLGTYDMLGDYRLALDFVDQLNRVTPADITAFAKRWFEPTRSAQINPTNTPTK